MGRSGARRRGFDRFPCQAGRSSSASGEGVPFLANTFIAALLDGDFRTAASTALRLRFALDDVGAEIASARLLVGFAVLEAEATIAASRSVPHAEIHRLLVRQARRARDEGWLLTLFNALDEK